jgi:hypothetical protein
MDKGRGLKMFYIDFRAEAMAAILRLAYCETRKETSTARPWWAETRTVFLVVAHCSSSHRPRLAPGKKVWFTVFWAALCWMGPFPRVHWFSTMQAICTERLSVAGKAIVPADAARSSN